MQNPALDTLLQTMREALEKLERAVQLPSRKDFESMTSRVSELSRRIEALEKSVPRRGTPKNNARNNAKKSAKAK